MRKEFMRTNCQNCKHGLYRHYAGGKCLVYDCDCKMYEPANVQKLEDRMTD